MNKLIIGKEHNKIIINSISEISEIIEGIANFNIKHVLLDTNGNINFAGDKIVQFSMFLDNSSGYYNRLFTLMYTNGDDYLQLFLLDSSLYVSSKLVTYFSAYSIINNNLYGKALNCEIRKGTGNYISYFVINDVSLIATNQIISGGSTTGEVASGIGRGGITTKAGILPTAIQELNNATVWDLYVFDPSENIMTNHWKGYPAGDTLAAWQDQIGTLDAESETINSTRNINNQNNKILTFKNYNKLKIV
jgi:hypothetical protein